MIYETTPRKTTANLEIFNLSTLRITYPKYKCCYDPENWKILIEVPPFVRTA